MEGGDNGRRKKKSNKTTEKGTRKLKDNAMTLAENLSGLSVRNGRSAPRWSACEGPVAADGGVYQRAGCSISTARSSGATAWNGDKQQLCTPVQRRSSLAGQRRIEDGR
jgi:hypothetical protein